MTEKKTPYNKDRELCILGSALDVLTDKNHAKQADIEWFFSEIKPEHFYVPTHKIIYIAMQEEYKQSKYVTYFNLRERINKNKPLVTATFIAELTDHSIVLENAKQEASKLIKDYQKIETVKLAKTKLVAAIKNGEDINETILEIIERLEQSPTKKQSVRKKDLRSIEHIEDRKSKNSNNKNKITTGFDLLDEAFYFSSGELNTIQARSSHGKTSFMLSLVYKILKTNNACSCIFVTYESSVSNIRTKILNTISTYEEKRQVIKEHYDKNDKKWKEDYADESAYAFKIHDDYINEGRLSLQEHIPLENLENLIKEQRELTPNNTIILFLDYIQIIGHNIKSDGWEKIKLLATKLEEIAVKENVIIMIGSQVNDKGDTREGRDIYFSSSNVIDLFNHSHPKVKNSNKPLPNKEYWEPIDGHIVSISMEKSRNFEPKSFNKRFRFDGFKFWEADYPESYDNAIEKISKKKELSKVDKEFQIK